MTRDEVLAMAEQAGFSIDYARTIPSVYGDAECVKHLISLAFEAGRKAAEQDRGDAEKVKTIVCYWPKCNCIESLEGGRQCRERSAK